MICKNCGNKLIDGANFCGMCGVGVNRLDTIAEPSIAVSQTVFSQDAEIKNDKPATGQGIAVCKNCGREISLHANYCGMCGAGQNTAYSRERNSGSHLNERRINAIEAECPARINPVLLEWNRGLFLAACFLLGVTALAQLIGEIVSYVLMRELFGDNVYFAGLLGTVIVIVLGIISTVNAFAFYAGCLKSDKEMCLNSLKIILKIAQIRKIIMYVCVGTAAFLGLLLMSVNFLYSFFILIGIVAVFFFAYEYYRELIDTLNALNSTLISGKPYELSGFIVTLNWIIIGLNLLTSLTIVLCSTLWWGFLTYSIIMAVSALSSAAAVLCLNLIIINYNRKYHHEFYNRGSN